MYSVSTKVIFDNLDFIYIFDKGYILLTKYKSWCKENVGKDNWNYYGVHQKTPYIFRFKREEDLLAFRLVFGI